MITCIWVLYSPLLLLLLVSKLYIVQLKHHLKNKFHKHQELYPRSKFEFEQDLPSLYRPSR